MKQFYVTICFVLTAALGFGQVLGDYRSNGTVDFNTSANWQVLTALPSTWSAATVSPASAAANLGNTNTVTVLSAHSLRYLNNYSFASNTNFTILIQGTIISSGAFTVSYGNGSSTVRIERSANYSATNAFQNHTFRNLVLAGTSGTPTFSFTTALKVTNSLTLTNANLTASSLALSSNTVTVNASGDITFTGAQSITSSSLTMNFSGNGRKLIYQSTLGLSGTPGSSLALNFSGTGSSFSLSSNFSIDNSSFTTSFPNSSGSAGAMNFNGTLDMANNSQLNLNGDYAVLSVLGNSTQVVKSSINLLGNNQQMLAQNGNTITLSSNGYINLSGANGLLDLGTNGSFSGANASNYVQLSSTSSVRRQIKTNNNFTFPIGTSTTYLPITVANQPGGGNPDFTVGVFTGATIDANPSGTPLSKSTIADAVWLVSQDGNSPNPVTLNVGWTTALEGSVFSTLTNSQIGISSLVKGSSTWQAAAAGTANNTSNTFLSNNVTIATGAQNAFVIGQINQILSITTRNFSAYAYNETSRLRWTAMATSLNSHFEIERSASSSGKFEKIASVQVLLAGEANYEYVDPSPSRPESYYRIKIVDENGNYTFSKTVKISFTGQLFSVDNLYPSVCSNTVNLLISSNRPTQIQLTVIDLSGRTAKTQVQAIGAGSNTYSVDVSTLAKGQYFLILNNNQQLSTKQFIKQ